MSDAQDRVQAAREAWEKARAVILAEGYHYSVGKADTLIAALTAEVEALREVIVASSYTTAVHRLMGEKQQVERERDEALDRVAYADQLAEDDTCAGCVEMQVRAEQAESALASLHDELAAYKEIAEQHIAEADAECERLNTEANRLMVELLDAKAALVAERERDEARDDTVEAEEEHATAQAKAERGCDSCSHWHCCRTLTIAGVDVMVSACSEWKELS